MCVGVCVCGCVCVWVGVLVWVYVCVCAGVGGWVGMCTMIDMAIPNSCLIATRIMMFSERDQSGHFPR